MKKYLFITLFVVLGNVALAQTDTSLLYQRFPVVPVFRLINVADSSIFTKANLNKKKATIIIIFSPTCENCVEETKELKENINLFKKAQIVMVSPLDFNYLKDFYIENNIAQFPAITIGRDPGYYLGTFYKVRSMPSIFIYDKKGKLKKWFIGSTPVTEIAAAL